MAIFLFVKRVLNTVGFCGILLLYIKKGDKYSKEKTFRDVVDSSIVEGTMLHFNCGPKEEKREEEEDFLNNKVTPHTHTYCT